MSLSSKLNFVALNALVCGGLMACGVKSPPTPVLPAPPGRLQQEVERRALEKKEKEKQKSKESDKAQRK